MIPVQLDSSPPLSAEALAQLEVSRYIYFVILGAFCWDILTNFPDEYKLIFKHKLGLPTFAYFFSRMAAMSFLVTNIVFQVSNVSDCQALQVAIGFCYCAASSSASFLFYLRIRAMFDHKPIVIYVFSFLWLCVLGSTMIIPFAIGGEHIGLTQKCINTRVKSFSSVGLIVPSVNDACVLLAISWRVLTTVAEEEGLRGRLRSFLGKTNLPTLSKAVLRSGQQYYIITPGGNLLALTMILAPSVPPVYRAMFSSPNVALMNSMACRVYRHIKLKKYSSTGLASYRLGDPRIMVAMPERVNHLPPHQGFSTGDFSSATISAAEIYVTKGTVKEFDPVGTVKGSQTMIGSHDRKDNEFAGTKSIEGE